MQYTKQEIARQLNGAIQRVALTEYRFWKAKMVNRLSNQEVAVYELIIDHYSITAPLVAYYMRISLPAANNLLKALLDYGLLQRWKAKNAKGYWLYEYGLTTLQMHFEFSDDEEPPKQMVMNF